MSNQHVAAPARPKIASAVHRYEAQDEFKRHKPFDVFVPTDALDAKQRARTIVAKRLGMFRESVLVRYTGTVTKYVTGKD